MINTNSRNIFFQIKGPFYKCYHSNIFIGRNNPCSFCIISFHSFQLCFVNLCPQILGRVSDSLGLEGIFPLRLRLSCQSNNRLLTFLNKCQWFKRDYYCQGRPLLFISTLYHKYTQLNTDYCQNSTTQQMKKIITKNSIENINFNQATNQ